MSCTNCPTSSPLSTFEMQYFYSNQCFDCTDNGCGGVSTNSKCVFYAGPNLPCSGIETNDSIELALQKIDEQICSISGDYSTYNFHCLDDWYGETISTEEVFVNAITGYACEIVTTLEEFTGTTFPAFETEIGERVDALDVPEITCSFASVTSSDNLNTILTKYCTAFSTLNSAMDISAVDWDSCYTVVTPPTTIAGAFSLIIDQICQTKALTGVVLPTFNNTGGCLSGGTSSDSLSTTISLIKTRLCLSPTLDNDNLSSSCISIPSTDTDLESLLQNMLDKLDELSQNYVTFDGSDFSVSATDGGDSCAGITVALATPINQDRFVAVDGSDTSPGTLISKITAGTGITITNNGTDIELSASGTTDSYEVKASSSDTDPDFLDQKLNGGSDSGVTISPIYNGGTKKIDLIPSVDLSTLFDAMLDELEINPELYTKFCEKVANCPSPCDPPTNVSATPQTTTTTLAP